MSNRTYDVIVIGAGAAGLAAAAECARAGRSVLVLEARERIGGRAWTRRMPGLALPVELGAEFIHGRASATMSLLKQARMATVRSARTQRYAANGRLRDVDSFSLAQEAMRDTRILAARDMSIAAYLARQRHLDPVTRTFASLMVQGFDAADPALASARAIAEEWGGGDALLGAQPRLREGYGPALEWLAQQFVARAGHLRMQSVVREVHWQPGRRVEVSGHSFSFAGSRAIVTLPLGVLQSGDVRFSPGLGKEAPLKSLASGPVIKAALRFPNPFWEKRHRGVAFFHSPRAAFPTFWTPLPARVPLLIAWAGGPKAQRLAGRSPAGLLRTVLASLRTLFPRCEDPDQVYVQDWQSDPYARGAYSYVRVNGEGAREALAAPLAGTLFFAGEATNAKESGTVAGALQSGIDAARTLLQSTP